MNTKHAKKLIKDIQQNMTEPRDCSIRHEVWNEDRNGLDMVELYIAASKNKEKEATFISANNLSELKQKLTKEGIL